LPGLARWVAVLTLAGSLALHAPTLAQTASDNAAEALTARLEALLAGITADAPTMDTGTPFLVRFDSDVSGLAVGAPVTVKGIRIGTVRDVQVVIDSDQAAIDVPVVFDIVPGRLQVDGATATDDDHVYAMAEQLVGKGLRAAVVTSSLLGGRQHVALAFVPEAPPATLDRDGRYPEIPAAPSIGDQLQANADKLFARLSALPVEEAVDQATLTFSELRTLLTGPEMRQMLQSLGAAGSELQSVIGGPEMQQAMRRAADAAGQFGDLVARLDTQLEPSIAAMQRAVASIEVAAAEVAASIGGLESTVGPRSPLWDELLQTSRELANSTRALRLLVEYLERHPDALLRGRPETQP